MTDMQDKESRELTFSQREGKAPLPEALQVRKLTKKFRNKIWRLFEIITSDCISIIHGRSHWIGKVKYWELLARSYHINVLEIPHDEIQTDPGKVRRWLKSLILEKEYHEVLTFLEHILRFKHTDPPLVHLIEECMKLTPYLIDKSSEPVWIIPTTSEEMKETVKQSLGNINKSKLIGAKSHLRKATQELNNENYPNSIRESIHAVESAVGQINPDGTKEFGRKVDSLERKGMIKHPALKKAFKSLYGYTSNEEGIRHSLLGKEAADVGFDEAIFMYAACVAFVDYLASKQRQLEGGETE